MSLINHRIKAPNSADHGESVIVFDVHESTGLAFVEIINGPNRSGDTETPVNTMVMFPAEEFDAMIEKHLASRDKGEE